MQFGRRIWTTLALALIVWLLPTLGFCFEDDPYSYKSLVGRLHFEYQRNAKEQDNNQTTSHRFLQRYSLDFRGFIVNRRLLIYDASYEYTRNNYISNNTDYNTSISDYFISTTALPLSAIPLNLYAGYKTSKTISEASESTTTQKRYGLRWHLNFKTLPKTTIFAERDQLESSDGTQTTTDTYRLDMEKELGPTYNYFSYYLVNSNSGPSDSSTYAINFSNNTTISRSTTFALGAAMSEGQSSDNPSTDLKAVNLILKSTPSKDFSQRHSYNYYTNETDGDTQTASLYSGDMHYYFTKRLNAVFTLDVDNRKSSTETSTSESTSLSSAISAMYKLTANTDISQLVSYSTSEYNSDDSASNLSDIETFRTLTSVNHYRLLNWATFRVSAGVGYTDERSGTEQAGQAIEQNYSLNLSNIDTNKYIGANTSLNYSTRTTISGNDISHTRYAYNLNLYNKTWKEYLNASGRYSRSAETTYLSDIEKSREAYELKGISTYFKRTKFNARAIHERTYEGTIGNSRSTTLSFGVNHNRQLYKGQLGLGYSFSTNKSTYEGGSQKTNTTLYNLNYSRRLFKDIHWILTAYRSTQETLNAISSTTSIKNSMVYSLRSWQLTGDHEYRVSEYSRTERAETILMLRATRVFVRAW